MPKLLQISLIILAVIPVAVADALLKKASNEGSLHRAIQSPWMIGALSLYLFQILFLTYIFVASWELSFVGSLQTIFYVLVVLLAGIFIFRETVNFVQGLGILLAVGGVILISLPSGA